MRHTRFARFMVLAAVALCATWSGADDRDFLRTRAAPPNLMFILDTSGSMVGTTQVVPRGTSGSIVPFGMLPGGGDDPYSRMGVAKAVLREFVDSISDSNFALAGYAQEQPTSGQVVPTKHWVYQASEQDRFRFIEPGFAYRFGWSESWTGTVLGNPGEIADDFMIGFNPYFDPESPTFNPVDQYGPINAFDHAGLTYDTMPIYFGNCLVDDKGTTWDNFDDHLLDPPEQDDETFCMDRIFPFYSTGERDGLGALVLESWAYDFSRCDPTDLDAWDADGDGVIDDDACDPTWSVTVPYGLGTRVEHWRRRVRLELPDEALVGSPNHPLGIDTGGNAVGNELVPDTVDDDYNLDGSDDADLDGDELNDWLVWVDSVEQRSVRYCDLPEVLPTWTATNTPTDTPTFTRPLPRPTLRPTPRHSPPHRPRCRRAAATSSSRASASRVTAPARTSCGTSAATAAIRRH